MTDYDEPRRSHRCPSAEGGRGSAAAGSHHNGLTLSTARTLSMDARPHYAPNVHFFGRLPSLAAFVEYHKHPANTTITAWNALTVEGRNSRA